MLFRFCTIVISTVLFTTGCSLLAHNESEQGSSKSFLELQLNPHQMAANDIVSAIVQTEEFKSTSGPIRLPPDDTPYFTHLVASLRSLGYAVKHVSYSDKNRSEYSFESSAPGASKVYRYSLTVNGVTVARKYEDRITGLFPKTKMMVSGTTSRIRLDEAEFEEQDPSQVFLTGVEYVDEEPASAKNENTLTQNTRSNSSGEVSDNTDEVMIEAVPVRPVALKETDLPLVSYSDLLDKKPEDLDNMYYTDRSNFSDIFDSYEQVEKHIIVFPNDSMVLGPKGKAKARAIFNNIQPETEILSMVGCSHGNTAIEDGNRVLAIGRVKRIRDEFVDLGVDREQLFAEGCWAPVHFDEVFPRRGVVVSVLREKS